MEICDMINEKEEGPKDAVKAIRKRLLQNAGKNHKIIMYTLTVSIIINYGLIIIIYIILLIKGFGNMCKKLW